MRCPSCKSGGVFVFGSNLAGRHGAGAALHAHRVHGAIYGQGEGLQGNSYGIPTKDAKLNTLSLELVKEGVQRFLEYAKEHSTTRFEVTAIGTGLAGYRHSQIAPMFRNAPINCSLPAVWDNYL